MAKRQAEFFEVVGREIGQHVRVDHIVAKGGFSCPKPMLRSHAPNQAGP